MQQKSTIIIIIQMSKLSVQRKNSLRKRYAGYFPVRIPLNVVSVFKASVHIITSVHFENVVIGWINATNQLELQDGIVATPLYG